MKRPILDKIVVVDIEATCWEGQPPQNETSDIIEIGVCLLDVASGKRLEREGILVQPERSKVSNFCSRLTTLTQSQVEQGITFREACNVLIHRYNSKQRVWASYGNYDREHFEWQCRELNVNYPFGPTHINVKTLIAAVYGLNPSSPVGDAIKKV